MSAITNLQEPWNGHTYKEVEDFVTGKIDELKEKAYGDLLTPFTIEATEDETTIYFRQSTYAEDAGLKPLKVDVSTDGGQTWNEVTASSQDDGTAIATLNAGEKVLIRGNNSAYGYYDDSEDLPIENCNFLAYGPCYVYGNIMSLVSKEGFETLRSVNKYAFFRFFSDYDAGLDWSWVLSKDGEELLLPATTLEDYCYSNMFQGCTSLTVAPELPATTLESGCYGSMFNGCASLTTAPALPATTLAVSCYNSMFAGCTSLTNAPALPATTLANDCYRYMFATCTELTAAPVLPATTLVYGCYGGMFAGCTSLTVAPELPATTLASDCYGSMFNGCTSLTTAPALPATTLAVSCYSSIFRGCTALTTAPALPATTLAASCYSYMFRDCTSLTTAPELPATTLASNCYNAMFWGCTKLTTAPELPATNLANGCYEYMFYGCSRLSYIKALFTTNTGGAPTQNWVYGVNAAGTFIKSAYADWNVTGSSGIPSGWTVSTHVDLTKPFTIEATENGTKVYFYRKDYGLERGDYTVEVSTDGGATWTSKTAALFGDGGTVIANLDARESAIIRGTNQMYGGYDDDEGGAVNFANFWADKPCYVYGNIMSLVGGDDFAESKSMEDHGFAYFFADYEGEYGGSWVLSKDGEELLLPATLLADYCYQCMFLGCTSLTAAPELPATTLAYRCYGTMFRGCTSLTTAPELPATTLAYQCYSYMFRECTALTTAPATLPATTLTNYCYENMFQACMSLTAAPALPAKTLSSSCYSGMFNGCTNLSYIKALFTTAPSDSYTRNWVTGVKATGTFVKSASATWNVTGPAGVPSGWTVKTE